MARGGKGELPEVNAEAAISLLGELRDKDAATGLVEMLKFTMNPTGPSGRKLYHTTPKIPALINIGLPSLDPLIRKVASTDDEVIRERAGIVIDQILGTDMAVFFVRDRRDRETDDTKRQRLNRLLDQIDKVERNRKGKIHIGPLKPPPVISPQPK
jgi:HEAT repeat protein